MELWLGDGLLGGCLCCDVKDSKILEQGLHGRHVSMAKLGGTLQESSLLEALETPIFTEMPILYQEPD